jgi:TonB family protein
MKARTVPLAVVVGMVLCPAAYAQQEQVFKPGDGVVAPRLNKEVKPVYPVSARLALAEGVVHLECVVRVDGTPGDIRVVKSVHPALDEAAMRALSEWRFVPGTKDGRTVPVLVEVEVAFSLRDSAEPHRGPPLDSPEVYKKADGVTLPVLVKDVKPMYSSQAMRDRAQGSVKLEFVVLPDGTVGDVRVSSGLHPELDAEAERALRRWTFKPGTKDGVAVPVQLDAEMTFTLRR